MKRLFNKSFLSFLLAVVLMIPAGLVSVKADDRITVSNFAKYVYTDVKISDGAGKTAELSDYDKQKVSDEINLINPTFNDVTYEMDNSNAISVGKVAESTYFDGKLQGQYSHDAYALVGSSTPSFAFKINGIKDGEVTVKLSLPNDKFWNEGYGRIPKDSYALVLQYNEKNNWVHDQVSLIDDDLKMTFNYRQSDVVLVMVVGPRYIKDGPNDTMYDIAETTLDAKYPVVNVNTNPEQETLAYNDVNPNTPHIDNIEWMSTSGVSKGWDDGTFRPMDTVKRQDMAAFLRREAIRLGVENAATWKPSEEDWNKFTDVHKDTPHAEDILWLAQTDITTGYPDGTYQGMWPVYRQDMAAFLHRLAKVAGIDATGTKDFTDVKKSTPHAEDISWLGGTGISTGYSDGTYQGMWPVYRQDMAAFINRVDLMKK